MEDRFDFYNPTRLLFGEGRENEVGDIVKGYGFSSVFVLYGGGSAERSGLLNRIRESLKGLGISYREMGGIRPNPEIGFVRKALAEIKERPVDLLLAVGGGSVIDTAKSLGVAYYYEGDPFDFNLHLATPKKTLPVGVILTIASAGSESSNSCVIQDDERQIKQGFNSDVVRPLFAIENPALTLGVPALHVFAGVSDTMMHSLERYFCASDENELADNLALDVVKTTMEAGKALLKDPNDKKARASLMLCSSLSHDGFTSIGKKFSTVVHPLEHTLSAYCPSIIHGAGVALIYPAWAKHVFKKDLKKFANLTRKLFSLEGANEEETAIMGIRAMEAFFQSIGMPSSFGEVGLTSLDLAPLVDLATGNGTRLVGRYPQPLDREDVEAIYSRLLAKEEL